MVSLRYDYVFLLACSFLLTWLESGLMAEKTVISLNAADYHFNVTFSDANGEADVVWTKNRGKGNQPYPILGAIPNCKPGNIVVYAGANLWECASANFSYTDTLKNLASHCAAGDIPKYFANYSKWECAPDDNSCPNMDPQDTCEPGLVLGWVSVGTVQSYGCKPDQDTLASLSCPPNQIPSWSSAESRFVCAVDQNTDTLAHLSCGNGDTPTYHSPSWVCSETCQDTLTDLNCSPGQLVGKPATSTAWSCINDTNTDLCAGLPSLCKTGQALIISPSGSSIACGQDKGELLCAFNQWPVYQASTKTWVCGNDQNTNSLASVVCGADQVLKWSSHNATFECGYDADTLRAMTCPEQGQILKKLAGASAFECAPDNHFDTLANVDTAACQVLVGDGLNPVLGYESNSWECEPDCDTLHYLHCQDGNVARYNATSGSWVCSNTSDTLHYLSCQQGNIVEWNKALGKWQCAVFPDILQSLHCRNQQLPKFNATLGTFQCANDSNLDVLLKLHCASGQTIKFYEADPIGWVCAIDNNDDTLRDLGGPGGCANGEIPVFQNIGKQWVCGPPIVNTDTLRSLNCTPGQIPKVNVTGDWACSTDLTCSEAAGAATENPTLFLSSGKSVLINSFLNPIPDTSLEWGSRTGIPPLMSYDGYVIGIAATISLAGLRTGSNVTYTVTINNVPTETTGHINGIVLDPTATGIPVLRNGIMGNYITFPAPLPFSAGDSIGFQISTNQGYAVGSPQTVATAATLFITLVTQP